MTKKSMQAFENRDHPGNSSEHLTGGLCIEDGCIRPAGTAWSPYWCFECNIERMKRISQQLENLL